MKLPFEDTGAAVRVEAVFDFFVGGDTSLVRRGTTGVESDELMEPGWTAGGGIIHDGYLMVYI